MSIDYQLIICVVRRNGPSAGSGGCRAGVRPLDYGPMDVFAWIQDFFNLYIL